MGREVKEAFRPEVLRLEDRVVPGETMGASMPWALSMMPYASALADAAWQSSRPTPASGTETRVTYSEDSWRDDDAAGIAINPTRNEDSMSKTTPAADTNQSVDTTNIMLSDDLGLDDMVSASGSVPLGSGIVSFNEHALGVGDGGMAVAAPSVGRAASFTPAMGGTIGGANQALAAGLAAQQASAASDGGMATPLIKAHRMVAPNGIHPFAGTGPYSPTQIRHAYGFDQITNKGAGQTIYIVDAYNDPNISNDLQTFDTQWGLQNPNLTVHKMSSHVRGNTSWGLEESLDVEWAHAIAPQANITLVEATSASTTALYAAVDWATNNGAHVVSMSWGATDSSGESSLDSHFNHTGVSYVASSGDTGGVVQYPSASPYVLSVGGTSLPLDANGNRTGAETAWSSGGGGASRYESEPGYQTSYGISLSGRGTPDVSYNADPNTGVYVYDTYITQPGWYEVGGTSAGAPQWAGLIALVNQSRSTPLSTNNLTSRTEYNAATGSVYGTNYNDITSGSNGYSAGPGYDLATGVGTPQANNLVGWLINNS
jgi:hypothetical protein